MATKLKDHFSAAYHFVPDKIDFSTAITTWSMFYLKKNLKRPVKAIKKDINKFMGEKVIQFVTFQSGHSKR